MAKVEALENAFADSTISPVLNKLRVQIVSNDDCHRAFGDIVQKTTLCSIGVEKNTGTCSVTYPLFGGINFF